MNESDIAKAIKTTDWNAFHFQLMDIKMSPIYLVQDNTDHIDVSYNEKQKELDLLHLKKTFGSNSRWSIRKTMSFLEKYDINIEDYILVFSTLFVLHHKQNKAGINTNQIYFKKLQIENKKRKKLLIIKLDQLKNNNNIYVNSVQELKTWQQKYLVTSNKDFITFISENIDIPYTRKSIENIYNINSNSIYYHNERKKLKEMFLALNKATSISKFGFSSFVSKFEITPFNEEEIIKILSKK